MSEPLEDVQDAILDKLHRGDTIDRDAVLAAHPEHESALREFFRVLDVIEDAPAPESAVPASLGEFRIVRELGRGGMGVVYEAEQSSLKRRVALKVLPPALRTDPRLVMRFRREAEAAGKLRHPGIVPVYSVGEVAGTPFFAMELVQGRSLDAIVRDLREGRDAGVPAAGEPRRRWVLETVAKVADALDYAHARGILHRDVKPGNVILDEDGAPRLTDFGLALDVSAPGLTMAGEVFGSIHYMSPEQAIRRESPIDARTDVYSLAVTLYELLTLRLPYEGTSSAELLTALTLGRLVPIRDADPSIPQPLADVVMHALRREPPERYASAAAFATDLRAVLAGTPPSAPPPVPVAAPSAAAAPAVRPDAVRRNPRDKHRDVRRSVLLRVPWPVKVLFVFVALLLWGGLGDGLRGVGLSCRGPVGVGGTAAAPLALTYDELEEAADGRAGVRGPQLAQLLDFWVQVRPVLSRKDLTGYRCGVTWNVVPSGRIDAPVVAAVAFEVSVDGGPWARLGRTHTDFGASQREGRGDPRVPDRISMSCSPSLADVLGGALREKAASSVTFRHRATFRVTRRPPGWDGDDVDALTGGSTYTWTDDERSCLVYDDYPADYPAVVADPDVDGPMRRSVVPSKAVFTGISVGADGTRTLDLFVTWTGPEGTLPVAFEVDLHLAGHDEVVGTAAFTWHARTGPPVEDTKRYGTLHFGLPGSRGPDPAPLVLKLDSGDPVGVHLVFRPARRVALRDPGISRYWGGTAEADLSVTKGTASVGLDK